MPDTALSFLKTFFLTFAAPQDRNYYHYFTGEDTEASRNTQVFQVPSVGEAEVEPWTGSTNRDPAFFNLL